MKKQERLVIMFDKEHEANFYREINEILNDLTDFINEANKHIQNEDWNVYKPNLYSGFVELFRLNFFGELSERIPIEKQMELVGVNSDKLKFLSNKLAEAKHEIDYNTKLPLNIPDFNYYCREGFEAEFIKLQKVCDFLNEYKETDSLHYQFITQGFVNRIMFDIYDQVFKVNFYLFQ